MIGVICLVQGLNYPLFQYVGKESFNIFHANHMKKTTLVIGIPMILELMSLVAIFVLYPTLRSHPLLLISAILIILAWAVTFLISVPLHDKLSLGADEIVLNKLVNTNWIRTIAWIVRGIILLGIENQFLF